MGLLSLHICPAGHTFIWRRFGGGKIWSEICFHLRSVQGIGLFCILLSNYQKSTLIETDCFWHVNCDFNGFISQVVAIEFGSKLSESQKSHGVIETGYSHTRSVSFIWYRSLFIFINMQCILCIKYKCFSEKKKTKYVKSELRLIETLDGICDRILQYNIHKVS